MKRAANFWIQSFSASLMRSARVLGCAVCGGFFDEYIFVEETLCWSCEVWKRTILKGGK